jgi:hypothetical protein
MISRAFRCDWLHRAYIYKKSWCRLQHFLEFFFSLQHRTYGCDGTIFRSHQIAISVEPTCAKEQNRIVSVNRRIRELFQQTMKFALRMSGTHPHIIPIVDERSLSNEVFLRSKGRYMYILLQPLPTKTENCR